MKTKSEVLDREFEYETRYIGERKTDGWKHDKWIATINGTDVEFNTGLGHRQQAKKTKAPDGRTYHHAEKPVPPKLDMVLQSVLMDAQCGQETFEDFCSELGYDTDSRRALDTYLACQKMATTRRHLGLTQEDNEKFSNY